MKIKPEEKRPITIEFTREEAEALACLLGVCDAQVVRDAISENDNIDWVNSLSKDERLPYRFYNMLHDYLTA